MQRALELCCCRCVLTLCAKDNINNTSMYTHTAFLPLCVSLQMRLFVTNGARTRLTFISSSVLSQPPCEIYTSPQRDLSLYTVCLGSGGHPWIETGREQYRQVKAHAPAAFHQQSSKQWICHAAAQIYACIISWGCSRLTMAHGELSFVLERHNMVK